jgi:AcrR family transcriptional regulator
VHNDRGKTVHAPQQERSKLTAERILAAAEQVLASATYANFSMTLVSTCSGLSIGGLYARFPNKEALLREVKNDVLLKLEGELKEGLCGAQDLTSTIRSFVRTLSDSFASCQHLYAFIFTHSAGDSRMRERGFIFHRRAKHLFTNSVLRNTSTASFSTEKLDMAYEFIVQGLLMRVTSLGSVGSDEYLYDGIPTPRNYSEALVEATVLYLTNDKTTSQIG